MQMPTPFWNCCEFASHLHVQIYPPSNVKISPPVPRGCEGSPFSRDVQIMYVFFMLLIVMCFSFYVCYVSACMCLYLSMRFFTCSKSRRSLFVLLFVWYVHCTYCLQSSSWMVIFIRCTAAHDIWSAYVDYSRKNFLR